MRIQKQFIYLSVCANLFSSCESGAVQSFSYVYIEGEFPVCGKSALCVCVAAWRGAAAAAHLIADALCMRGAYGQICGNFRN